MLSSDFLSLGSFASQHLAHKAVNIWLQFTSWEILNFSDTYKLLGMKGHYFFLLLTHILNFLVQNASLTSHTIHFVLSVPNFHKGSSSDQLPVSWLSSHMWLTHLPKGFLWRSFHSKFLIRSLFVNQHSVIVTFVFDLATDSAGTLSGISFRCMSHITTSPHLFFIEMLWSIFNKDTLHVLRKEGDFSEKQSSNSHLLT